MEERLKKLEKIVLVLFILVLINIILVLVLNFVKITIKKEPKDNKLVVEKIPGCNEKLTKYSFDNYNLYLNCVKAIYGGKDLNIALKERMLTKVTLREKYIPEQTFEDGTSFYNDKDKTVVICGSNDLYIGDESMGFKEDYCKDNSWIEDHDLTIEETSECESVTKTEIEGEGFNLYTHCINAYYGEDDLWEALHLRRVTRTILRDKYEPKLTMRDGGSSVYNDEEKTIIICNNLNGNKDIHIGNSSLNYEEVFCKNP